MPLWIVASHVVLWLLVIGIVILMLALVQSNRKLARAIITKPLGEMGLAPGTEAPALLANLVSGEQGQLDDSPYTLFLFVSPTCKPCVDKLPEFDRYYDSANEHGLTTALVVNGSEEEAINMTASFQSKMPIFAASKMESTAFTDYAIAGTPSYCLIDSNNVVLKSGIVNQQLNLLVPIPLTEGALSGSSRTLPSPTGYSVSRVG